MNSNAGWDFNRTANTTGRIDMIKHILMMRLILSLIVLV